MIDLTWLQEALDSDDLQLTPLADDAGRPVATAAYVRPLVDPERLVREVYEPLRQAGGKPPDAVLPHASAEADRRQVCQRLLEGHVAVISRKEDVIYLVPVPRDKSRDVSEATTEVQLLGPKAAFTESLDTNLNLVRRCLPSVGLRVKEVIVGRISRTRVALVYLDGVANADLGPSLLKALNSLDLDVVRGSNDIQELLIGRSLTPFPLAQKTERPDLVAEGIANGRAAVIVNGTPFALLVPTTLNDLIRNHESFLGGAVATVFVRWVRMAGLILAALTPGLYAALLGVNPQIVPPQVLSTVAATREGIPYSVLFETLMLLIVLDLVSEAALQAPTSLGQTLTMAGSLIIGQAAVQARLASQMMIIVLALTSIGTLLALNLPLTYPVRIWRYPLVILGGTLGLYGLVLGVIATLTHLASIKSWGVPYLAPLGPVQWQDLRLFGLLSATKGNRTLRPQMYDPKNDRRAPPGGRRRK